MQQVKSQPSQQLAKPEPALKRLWFDFFIIALCCAGIFIAGYLTYKHFDKTPIFCATAGGCETVQKSEYSSFLGIPVSIIGLFGYIVLLGGAIARMRFAQLHSDNALQWRGRLDWGLFLAALIGIIFSGYLIAMSFFVIQASCSWCLSSASIMTGLFIIFAARLWQNV